MKQTSANKNNGYQSDDDKIRYKLNTKFFQNSSKPSVKSTKKQESVLIEDDEGIRYKFPTSNVKTKSPEKKPKPKSKIKVNFWSNKQNVKRLHNHVPVKEKNNRRQIVGAIAEAPSPAKPKPSMAKVCKQVSFLPSPLFSDNHVPMVTVPDDLTIQLNEEEVNDLGEDFNQAFANNESSTITKQYDKPAKRKHSSMTQTSPKNMKQKRSNDRLDGRTPAYDNELEFFSKYVVQKLRRMETNQRIYSENLINTVLMLGQLGKLNVKSKIGDA